VNTRILNGLLLLAALLAGPASAGEPQRPLDLGERMYRDGLLPSGKPLQAVMKAGTRVPGTAFACAGCHGRSGIPPMQEDGVRVRAINGRTLFQPLYLHFTGLTPEEREALVPARFKTAPLRPAYTERSLMDALVKGVDPSGRELGPAMPRYRASDAELAPLVQYLGRLSSAFAPGVSDTSVTFATVVTEEVPAADRAAMTGAIERSLRSHSNLRPNPRQKMGQMLNMQLMGIGFREWRLATWVLKGEPATWHAQLEAFYAKEPVFALLGGISTRTWEPVHRFCESLRLPCVLPLTDLPGLEGSYTFYYTKGYHQEGASAARFLAQAPPARVVQILGPGSEAALLAKGFEEAWAGRTPVQSIPWNPSRPVKADKDTALLMWTGPDGYRALEAMARTSPPQVFMSSTLLAERLWDLPEAARDFTRVVYPYRQPGPKTLPPRMGARVGAVVDKPFQANDRRIASRMEDAMKVLSEALARMERNYYRDYLLDTLDAAPAAEATDYDLLNFSPGLRHLSEGCHVVRLQSGPARGFDPKETWGLY